MAIYYLSAAVKWLALELFYVVLFFFFSILLSNLLSIGDREFLPKRTFEKNGLIPMFNK